MVPVEMIKGMEHLTNPDDSKFEEYMKDESARKHMTQAIALIVGQQAKEYPSEAARLAGAPGAGSAAVLMQKVASVADVPRVMESSHGGRDHTYDFRRRLFDADRMELAASVTETVEAMGEGELRKFTGFRTNRAGDGSHVVAVERRGDEYRILNGNDEWGTVTKGTAKEVGHIVMTAIERTDPELTSPNVADMRAIYRKHSTLSTRMPEIFGGKEKQLQRTKVLQNLQKQASRRPGGASSMTLSKFSQLSTPMTLTSNSTNLSAANALELLRPAVRGAAAVSGPPAARAAAATVAGAGPLRRRVAGTAAPGPGAADAAYTDTRGASAAAVEVAGPLRRRVAGTTAPGPDT